MPARFDVNKSKTLSASQVTVATTATLIAAANPNRKFIEINNIGAAAVFVGGSAVTTGNGHQILNATKMTISGAITTAAIYGIVAAGTNVVTVLEF